MKSSFSIIMSKLFRCSSTNKETSTKSNINFVNKKKVKSFKIVLPRFMTFLILFSLFTISGTAQNRNQTGVKRLTFKNNKKAPLKGVPYKSFKVVALETNDKCLLREIIEVRPYLSNLYVLDGYGALFVFDSNGKFINQVGKKGNGPDEYLRLNSFFINKKDQSISIIDAFKNKIFNYDLTGKYINSSSVISSIQHTNNSTMAKDGNIILNYDINFGKNKAYSLLDGNNYNKNVYFKSYAPIEVKGYIQFFSHHPMSENTDGKINFIMPLCDTIFEYSNKKFSPKYIVDIPEKMVERKLIKASTDKGESYFSILGKYGRNGLFTGFTKIFETNKHILLENLFQFRFYLANKESLEGNYYLFSPPGNPVKIPLRNIVGSNDHEFIGVYSATELIELYDEFDKNSTTDTFNQLKKVVYKLDEESNPCLVFYTIE